MRNRAENNSADLGNSLHDPLGAGRALGRETGKADVHRFELEPQGQRCARRLQDGDSRIGDFGTDAVARKDQDPHEYAEE